MDLTPDLADLTSPPVSQDFWLFLDRLVSSSRLVVDRPKDSRHPRYPDMVYPLDYGYLEGTRSMDGGGVDVWVGSLEGRSLDAAIFSVDLKKSDVEVKLLLGCTAAEKQAALDFLNGFSMRAILLPRVAPELALLKSRRSVRRFRPDPLPAHLLERILEAATWAPSAHNRQPWRFAVLTSPEAKHRLAASMGADFRRDLLAGGLPQAEVETQVSRSYQRITTAPAAVLLCLDPTQGDIYPDPARQQAEYLMGVQSVAMAGHSLLLAAHSLGLGGVWVCAPLFAPDTARQALELPPTWQPQGLLLLGYPARVPAPPIRRPVAEMSLFL